MQSSASAQFQKGEKSRGEHLLLWAVVVSAAVAFAACIVAVREPDTFHHLALGRDILRHGLRADEPFLYPFAGQKTGPVSYWLGSLSIYGWQALAGEQWIALLPALAASLVCAFVVLDALQREEDLSPRAVAAAALPVALAVGALRFRVQARPEIFGLVFFAVVSWSLRRFETAKRLAPLLALPFVFLAWANTHASVAAGLTVVAIHVASGALLIAIRPVVGHALPGTPDKRALLATTGTMVLCGAVTFVSPGGSPLRSAIGFASAAVRDAAPQPTQGSLEVLLAVRRMVSEMKPADARFWTQPAGLLLVITALALALNWRRARLREVAMFIAFAVLSVRATRFAAFAAIVAAPIAARALDELLRRLRSPLVARAGAVVLAAVALPVTGASAALHPDRPPGGTGVVRTFPRRCADYLGSLGFDGRIYNTFHLGGYLEWRGVARPYQDGRGVLHPDEVEAALAGPPAKKLFQGLDDEYRFDALLLAYPLIGAKDGVGEAALKGARDWLVERDEWALVAFDDGGLLYLRRDGKYAAQAARDEYRLVAPATSFLRWQSYELPRMLQEYDRSIRESPECARCREQFGTLAVAARLFREAAATVGPVLEVDGRPNVGALIIAAQAAAGSGDRATAAARYERAREAGEDDVAPSALARLAFDAGNYASAERLIAPKLARELPARADLDLGLAIAAARGDVAWIAALQAKAERLARVEAASVFFFQGLSAFGGKRYAEAVSLFEESIARDGSSAAAYSNLGFAYEELGRLGEAVAAQRRAIAVDARYANAHYALAAVLAKMNDHPGAVASYRRYLELEPSGLWSARAAQAISQLEAR